MNGYIHIEARSPEAEIIIGHDVWINNNASIISERSRIEIGDNTLIGSEFTVYDSDFHDLHPLRRTHDQHQCSAVSIGNNVFIGSRVMVLKGVVIGDNSVVASGAVVAASVPANCIVGGVPARIIGEVNYQ
jgi:maltose O-acetyltransferase